MKHIKSLPILILAIAVSACATTPNTSVAPERILVVDERDGTSLRTSNPPGGLRTPMAASADRVWNATTSSFAFLKIPVTYTNQERGEQGNTRFVMSRTFNNRPISEYLNCGNDPMSGPNANLGRVTVAIVAKIQPEGTTSNLETLLTGSVVKSGASSAPVYCASTGAFEKHFAEMVASRLNQ